MNHYFMNESLAKRTLAMALTFSLIFGLSRTITVICHLFTAPSHVAGMTLSAQAHPVSASKMSLMNKAKLKPAVLVNVAQLHGLALNSNFRTYHALFSGRVTCNDQPCAASLQVALASTNNPDLHKVFQTASDGSFNVDLTLSEIPHEQVDWKLSASRGELLDAEAHGRQILMDAYGLNVNQSFNLN